MGNDQKNISGGVFANTKEEFQVRSASSAVCFNTDYAPPPAGIYIGVDDQLLIQNASFFNTTVLDFNVRILRTDGKIIPLKFQVGTFANRAFIAKQFALMEGWLLSCSVSVGGPLSNNQWVYAAASIVRAPFGNNNQYEQLIAGYLNSNVGLSYPQSQIQRPTDGAGTVRSILGTSPGAGAEIVETVPVGARWYLLGIRAQLVTAVAVANRIPVILITDGGGAVTVVVPNVTQVASLTNEYDFFVGAPLVNTPIAARTSAPLPSDLRMAPGWTWQTSTTGLQPADQWNSQAYTVLEWLENK